MTIPDDPHYSQPFANALTVATWLCPLALNNANVVGGSGQVCPLRRKGGFGVGRRRVGAQILQGLQNKTRHSRLSFYTFNLGSPTGEGNGSYMEYGVSKNDETPIELGQWVFVVGEAEPWISPSDLSTGCALWKQGVAAKRELAEEQRRFRRTPTARIRLDYGRGVAGNRLPGGDRAFGDLEPTALGRRNRLDLERLQKGPSVPI